MSAEPERTYTDSRYVLVADGGTYAPIGICMQCGAECEPTARMHTKGECERERPVDAVSREAVAGRGDTP